MSVIPSKISEMNHRTTYVIPFPSEMRLECDGSPGSHECHGFARFDLQIEIIENEIVRPRRVGKLTFKQFDAAC